MGAGWTTLRRSCAHSGSSRVRGELPLRITLLGRDWTLYFTRGGVVGLSFLSMLLMAAVMEPPDFGRFVFLWAVAGTLAAFAGLGGPGYLLREASARQGDPARGVSRFEALRIAVLWPSCLLIAVAVAVLGPGKLVLAFFEQGPPETAEVSLVCIVAWLLVQLGHVATPFRIDNRLSLSMLVRDAGPHLLLLAVVGVAAVMGRASPVPVLSMFAAAGAVSIVLLGILAVGVVTAPLWRVTGTRRAGGLMSFWGNAMLGTCGAQIDILLGGIFLNNVELGQYQILKRLANLSSLPQIAANWAVVVGIGRAFAASSMDDVQVQCRRGALMAFPPGLVLLLLVGSALPGFLWLYDIENTIEAWTVFGLVAAGAVTNLACGANFAAAAQCQLEHFAMGARAVGILTVTAVVLAYGSALTPVGLAFAMFVSLASANFLLCLVVHRRLLVDTTFLCVLRTAKNTHADVSS